MRIRDAASLGGFCLGALLLVGCEGSGVVEVKGTVTVDGKLVDKGAIGFFPVDAEASGTGGGAIVDGKYLAKVPVGDMKVTISFPKVVGTRKAYDTPDSPIITLREESLPKKYSDREDTELRFDVKAGQNQKDWDLKTP